jgi:hypothetical protein
MSRKFINCNILIKLSFTNLTFLFVEKKNINILIELKSFIISLFRIIYIGYKFFYFERIEYFIFFK